MEYISPAENNLFIKALRFLYERRLAMEGVEADIIPYLPDESLPEEPEGVSLR